MNTLDNLGNIELRMFKTAEGKRGFHTKGYLFHNKSDLRIIVGSSNLTQDAITKNYEWNTKIVSTVKGEFARDIEKEFNDLWETSVASYAKVRIYPNILSGSSRARPCSCPVRRGKCHADIPGLPAIVADRDSRTSSTRP